MKQRLKQLATKARHWAIKKLGGYVEQRPALPPMQMYGPVEDYTVERLEGRVNVARVLNANEVEHVVKREFVYNLDLSEFIEVHFTDDPMEGKVMHMDLRLLKKKHP